MALIGEDSNSDGLIRKQVQYGTEREVTFPMHIVVVGGIVQDGTDILLVKRRDGDGYSHVAGRGWRGRAGSII